MSSCEESELPTNSMSPLSAGRSHANRGRILLLLVVVLVVAYWIGIFVSLEPGILMGVSDFSGFYAAGKMVLTGHSSQVYDYRAELEAQRPFVVEGRSPVLPFVFAPYSLALFAPLAALPYPRAVVVWFAINIAILLTIPFLLRHRLQTTNKNLAFAFIGMAFFYPLSISLAQGQLTPVTLLLFTLVFLGLSEEHDFRAGAILAVALYKPQFVFPLLLVLIFHRYWNAVRGFCWSCVGLFGVSLLLVGWNSTLGFPAAMIESARLPASIGEPGAEGMANVRGLLQSLLDSHLPHKTILLMAGAASILLLIGLLAVMARRRRASELGFALVITVTVLASYHCYKHDMGLVILALFLVAHYLTVCQMTNLRIALAVGAGLTLLAPSTLPSPATVIVLILFSAILVTEFVTVHKAAKPYYAPEPHR